VYKSATQEKLNSSNADWLKKYLSIQIITLF